MSVLGWVLKEARRNDYPYYRQIWSRVVLSLLTVSLFPLLVIGGGVCSYTLDKIESQTLDALRAQVRRHGQAIDEFLTERERQLRLIAGLQSMDDLIAPGRLEHVFEALQKRIPGFMDLGVIDMQGRHLAYVGPYALQSENYRLDDWFGKLMHQDSYISDVYLGHRRTPHFIMAVKQGRDNDAFILRATVDSLYFNSLVAAGPGEHEAEAFIVNAEGMLQTIPRTGRDLLTPSGVHPDPNVKGVQLVSRQDVLMLTLWQEKVPWLNVVKVKRSHVYAGIRRARMAVIITFIAGALLITATIFLTTGKLVRLLEAKGQSLRLLDKQLRRTSHLASSMELSMGFFEEVKDIFSNIDVSVQWLVNHNSARTAPDILETLLQITGEASRGHMLFDKFVTFVRSEDPIVSDVHIDELLNDLIVFLTKELERRNIQVIRQYHTPMPSVRSDRGKLRQVFQNLILNAIAAVDNGGQISLLTRTEGSHIIVVVSDNGPGIPAVDQERIFEPLYTTRPQGNGLGLPICRTILERLGGSLTVISCPGQGAAFSVTLPVRITPEPVELTSANA